MSMLFLITVILASLGFVYFALQNMAGITITLANYQLLDVPIYLVVLGSLLLGLFISWLLSTISSIATEFTIYGKDKKINRAEHAIDDLHKKIVGLEKENAQLKRSLTVATPTIAQ